MDEKDLKITALTERIGEIVVQYEERVADLRVLLTQQEQRHNAPDAPPSDEEVLEGEVV